MLNNVEINILLSIR